MSFPVNIPIQCVARITPFGGQAPAGVTLTVVSPGSVSQSVPVSLDGTNQQGTYTYRGAFLPTSPGAWTRTWAGSNLLSSSVAILTVA